MILHISDLHIGKVLNGYSLINDQKYVLDQIIEVIKLRKIKYLVIAGDIYDKYLPSNEATELFEKFIIDISKLNIRTIIISGNHDSKTRLSYLSTFLKENNIYIFTNINKEVEFIEFDDDKISFLPLPYVNYSDLKFIYKSDKSNDNLHEDIINSYFEKANKDYHHICIAHNLVTGSKLSDSERTLSIGGLDELSRELFYKFDYTALGHLHIKQHLGNNIYYCGSLLKYSVSEFNNINSINIYDYRNNKIEYIELNTLHNYRVINDYFDNIINNAKNDNNNEDYIHIELNDTKLIYDSYQRLLKYYPNLISVSNQNIFNQNIVNENNFNLENKNEIEIFEGFYKQLLKKDMDVNTKELIKNFFDELKTEEE